MSGDWGVDLSGEFTWEIGGSTDYFAIYPMVNALLDHRSPPRSAYELIWVRCCCCYSVLSVGPYIAQAKAVHGPPSPLQWAASLPLRATGNMGAPAVSLVHLSAEGGREHTAYSSIKPISIHKRSHRD